MIPAADDVELTSPLCCGGCGPPQFMPFGSWLTRGISLAPILTMKRLRIKIRSRRSSLKTASAPYLGRLVVEALATSGKGTSTCTLTFGPSGVQHMCSCDVLSCVYH